MNKKLTGILEIDFPELNPTDKSASEIAELDLKFRELTLGDPDTTKLPDGTTCREYRTAVELQQLADRLPDSIPNRESLTQSGLTSTESLTSKTVDELTELPGIGEKTAKVILKEAVKAQETEDVQSDTAQKRSPKK